MNRIIIAIFSILGMMFSPFILVKVTSEYNLSMPSMTIIAGIISSIGIAIYAIFGVFPSKSGSYESIRRLFIGFISTIGATLCWEMAFHPDMYLRVLISSIGFLLLSIFGLKLLFTMSPTDE